MNISSEEAEKILAEHEQNLKERAKQAERERKCPVCGARRERERRMLYHERDFIDYLLSNRIVQFDSCIICVKKHVGTAMRLYYELTNAKNSGKYTTGEGSVNIMLDHLAIIGELQCAAKESTAYVDLHDAIIEQERMYRYEGIEPNWRYIAALIVEYEKVIEAAGAVK
jgi:hypothetical protein